MSKIQNEQKVSTPINQNSKKSECGFILIVHARNAGDSHSCLCSILSPPLLRNKQLSSLQHKLIASFMLHFNNISVTSYSLVWCVDCLSWECPDENQFYSVFYYMVLKMLILYICMYKQSCECYGNWHAEQSPGTVCNYIVLSLYMHKHVFSSHMLSLCTT